MPFFWLNRFISCYKHRRSPGSSTTQCKTKLAPKTAFPSPGHYSDTVASTVARKHEENTKSGISCRRPCRRINRVNFWTFTTHMLPAWRPEKGFYKGLKGILKGRAIASWSHFSPSSGSELGGDLGGRFRGEDGEESKIRHDPPLWSIFWGEDDEGSHSLSGVFGSVIRPLIFEGVSLMFDLVVFIHFIGQIVVMNN